MRQANTTVSLTLNDGQVIDATPEHPIFVAGKSRDFAAMIPAGRLAIGTSILTRAGPALKLNQTQRFEWKAAPKTVYNFTVDNFHTYFVGKSSQGAVWVHNANPAEYDPADGNLPNDVDAPLRDPLPPHLNDVVEDALGAPNGIYPNLQNNPQLLKEEMDFARDVGITPILAGAADWQNKLSGIIAQSPDGIARIKWVITPKGEFLFCQRYVTGATPATTGPLSHAILNKGGSVIAAGEATIENIGGRLTASTLTNWSGHYHPAAGTEFSIGKPFFESFGINCPGLP